MSDLEVTLRAMVTELVRDELARMRPSQSPDLVTVAEYARRCSISESTVRAAIREGRLAAARIGRAVRIRADAEIGRGPDREARAVVARDARRMRLIGGR